MGACASKFTVLKNSAAAPLPDAKQEVEAREVVEEVAVNKDEATAVDDEANRRQSLGHLLKESEVKKGSAEDVKQDDGVEVKPEAVADVPAQDAAEIAPVAVTKSKNVEEEIMACKNVDLEVEKVEEKPAETVKPEAVADVPAQDAAEIAPVAVTKSKIVEEEITACKNVDLEVENVEEKPAETVKVEEPEVNKGVEIPCADKKPEVLEEEKPLTNEELKKDEEKPTEKIPEAQECEKTEELKPVSDAEKKGTVEKSIEIEVSEKKPESLEAEKPAENTKIEISDKVEDKHILEPLKTENCSPNETLETISGEQKPASDAEKPKAEEVKATN